MIYNTLPRIISYLVKDQQDSRSFTVSAFQVLFPTDAIRATSCPRRNIYVAEAKNRT